MQSSASPRLATFLLPVLWRSLFEKQWTKCLFRFEKKAWSIEIQYGQMPQKLHQPFSNCNNKVLSSVERSIQNTSQWTEWNSLYLTAQTGNVTRVDTTGKDDWWRETGSVDDRAGCWIQTWTGARTLKEKHFKDPSIHPPIHLLFIYPLATSLGPGCGKENTFLDTI